VAELSFRSGSISQVAIMDLGGYLWLIITVGFFAVLAGAMIYGTLQWRHRRKDRLAKEAEKKAVDRAYRD
jgi:hypothetical protein